MNTERLAEAACSLPARVVVSTALAGGIYALGEFPSAVMAFAWVVYAVLADRRLPH